MITSPQAQSDIVESEISRREGNPQDRLIQFLEMTLAPLGYELVTIEVINHREKVLRVFIDCDAGVGIEDCVKVTQALDLPLETEPCVTEVFSSPYELEVSSPGIDRPLRKPGDFTRFLGRLSRFYTFRPLTADETNAAEYIGKNPKQKNFYGVLRGYDQPAHAALLGVVPEDGTLKQPKKGQKKKTPAELSHQTTLKNETLIRIPLDLISKAHLEPEILFEE